MLHVYHFLICSFSNFIFKQCPITTILKPNSTAQPTRPKNCMAVSIFTTLFCCLPAGLSAIVFSSKVDRAYDAGDHKGAVENAKNAKLCNLIAVIFGLIFIPLVIYLRVKAIQEQDNS
ncbi:hypothetical protein ABFA07_002401 [Porites harrisoni]